MKRFQIIIFLSILPFLGYAQTGNVLASYSLNSGTDSSFFKNSGVLLSVGNALCNIGDLNADGNVDIATGCLRDAQPAIAIIFLNSDGTVKDTQIIQKGHSGFVGDLPSVMDGFGESIANIGDVDGDGTQDLLVGKPYNIGTEVFVLFMKRDGTIKKFTRIGEFRGGFNVDLDAGSDFGSSVSVLRDFDGDGLPEVAIGDIDDNTGGVRKGAIYILFLNSDGTVRRYKKIAQDLAGFDTTMSVNMALGRSSCLLGENQLIVGSRGPDANGLIWVLNLDDSANVVSYSTIGSGLGGLQDTITKWAYFGRSVANVGDLDGDQIDDLLVGSDRYFDVYETSGAAFLLFMNADGSVKSEKRFGNSFGPIPDSLEKADSYGRSVCGLGDLNNDNKYDIVIGASGHSLPGIKGSGRIDFLFLDGASHASDFKIEEEVLTVYPNPSKGEISFKGGLELEEVKIYNSYGQLECSVDRKNITTLDVSELTAGMYYLEATSKSNLYTSKFFLHR